MEREIMKDSGKGKLRLKWLSLLRHLAFMKVIKDEAKAFTTLEQGNDCEMHSVTFPRDLEIKR